MHTEQEKEIHAIKTQLDSLTKGNWFQKNMGVVVLMMIQVISAVVFVVTIGTQANSNSLSIAENKVAIGTKASYKLLQLELGNRDQKILNLESNGKSIQAQNEKLFEKLEEKVDKGNLLLQQILREMPRGSRD